jgi:hypothetical protein
MQILCEKILGGLYMSRFLGKIHFWLYDKIRYAEELEKKLERYAISQQELPIIEWKESISERFGTALDGKPLEDAIDVSNIHGWLQDRIKAVETRQAAWISYIVSEKPESVIKLQELFEEDGEEKGTLAASMYDITSFEDTYNILNNFILEGMPCDNVDAIMENDAEHFKWISTRCIHSDSWAQVGGDIKLFYKLRKYWIKGFITSINSEYDFNVEYSGAKRINTILKK